MIMIEGNLNSGKIAICNIYHTVGTFRTLHYLCNLTCYIVQDEISVEDDMTNTKAKGKKLFAKGDTFQQYTSMAW